MSMSIIDDIEAIDEDFLILIHCLNNFYGSLKDDDELDLWSPAGKKFSQMYDFLLDLLWGAVSFGNSIKVWPFPYLSQRTPPIERLLEFLYESKAENVRCYFHPDKNRLPQYKESKFLSDLLVYSPDKLFYDEKGAAVWKEILEQIENPSFSVVKSNIRDSVRIWRGLLSLREREFLRVYKHLQISVEEYDKDNDRFLRTELKKYQPVSLALKDDWKEIYSVLKPYEEEYLVHFMAGHVVGIENAMRWDKKLEYLQPILEKMSVDHGNFWISVNRLKAITTTDDSRPVSVELPVTLFALEQKGLLTVIRYQKDPTSDIEFLVHLVKKEAPVSATDEGEVPPKDCIELDPYISLSDIPGKQGLYLRNSMSWKFFRQPPQTVKIIRYLYDIRTAPENSCTVTQLAEKFTKTGTSLPPISRKLKELYDFCKNHDCKHILTSTSDGKWTLNLKLGCCKTLRAD